MRNLKNLIIFIMVALLFFVSDLRADAAFSQNDKLIGKGLLEFSIFGIDLYEISYLVNDQTKTERMILDYKRDISKKHSQMGWDQGLSHILDNNPKLETKIKWIKDNTVEVVEGDIVEITRKNNKVTISKNSKIVSTIEDEEIAKIIYEPWIGSQPVDENLKKILLKNITELNKALRR